ncbi:hypothetical protein [Caballeronia sp. LjRoot31]|uniref:hypothetical protein n=1 Tax=Caballeronia sp. LjRoot31 TaxID=3342324 RepID=UPI003ECDC0EE
MKLVIEQAVYPSDIRAGNCVVIVAEHVGDYGYHGVERYILLKGSKEVDCKRGQFEVVQDVEALWPEVIAQSRHALAELATDHIANWPGAHAIRFERLEEPAMAALYRCGGIEQGHLNSIAILTGNDELRTIVRGIRRLSRLTWSDIAQDEI